jgi:1-acyl-sn-glycerol-3-phosphate acyltransferase
MHHPLRVTIRLAAFCLIVLLSLLDFLLRIWFARKAGSARARAEWMQRWSRQHLLNLRISVAYDGPPPARGLLVSNHLSYTDILVFGAGQPFVFAAKSEVRGWPILGWLTRCAGTLFVQREKKTHVAHLKAEFAPVVEQGLVLALFPEGTSTDGHVVLPFHSSLLQPAVENQWPVTPAWIGYSLEDGSVEDEVCYWRDMTFGPHFLNLLSRRIIHARVVFGRPVTGNDRKLLAKELHAQVCAMAERKDRLKAVPTPKPL